MQPQYAGCQVVVGIPPGETAMTKGIIEALQKALQGATITVEVSPTTQGPTVLSAEGPNAHPLAGMGVTGWVAVLGTEPPKADPDHDEWQPAGPTALRLMAEDALKELLNKKQRG